VITMTALQPGEPSPANAPPDAPDNAPDNAPHDAPDVLDDVRVATVLEELALLAVREVSRPPRDMSLTAAATLSYLESLGSARLTTLANEQGVTQPSMTQLIGRLEREGLVRRSADPSDGRAVQVAITSTGREVLADRRTRRTERLTRIVGELPAADRRELAAAAEAFLPLLRRFVSGRQAVPGSPEPVPDRRPESGSHLPVEPLEFA
jgi:DNA-binding MarR family transcriptional regulator